MSNKYTTKPSHSGYNTAIEYNCDYCGITCYESRGSYNKRKRHFCSVNCYSLFRKHLLPKEEQHSYGSGLNKEERLKRKKARTKLNHYLRDNKIKRPDCEICGKENAEAHHDDYDKPLEVRWLCFKHHRMYHKHGDAVFDNPELLEKEGSHE